MTEVTDRQTVFSGRLLTVRVDTIAGGGTREVAVHPGASAVAAMDGAGRLALVRQHRHAAGRDLWEVPAGLLEPGEDPLSCAQRELSEETGFRARVWRHLSTFYTSPGFSTELVHLYLAAGVGPSGEADRTEIAELRMVPLASAELMVGDGRILDAKTIVAVLSVARLHPRQR